MKNHAGFNGNSAGLTLRAGGLGMQISWGRQTGNRRQPLELLIKTFNENECWIPKNLMIIWAWLLFEDALLIIAGKRPGAMWHEMAT
jgi:hypothetical protein